MSSDGFDEAACLRRVRERDEAACRELVRHLYPAVIRIVRAHVPRRDAEEDLVQEVFLKMFARLDQRRSELRCADLLARAQARIDPELTPEQSARLQKMRAARKRRLQEWLNVLAASP